MAMSTREWCGGSLLGVFYTGHGLLVTWEYSSKKAGIME